jgi:arylsulfatase A-like enzyme
VVWIVIDTTRADRVGCFGGPKNTTPHIDALCQRGLSFAEAYSQAPATMLSVASYMSGRYRRSTGIDFMLWEDQDFHPLSPEITTVAEALKGAGFQTIALTANPSISKASHAQGAAFDLDYDQGFDVWRYATDDEIAAQGSSPPARAASCCTCTRWARTSRTCAGRASSSAAATASPPR